MFVNLYLCKKASGLSRQARCFDFFSSSLRSNASPSSYAARTSLEGLQSLSPCTDKPRPPFSITSLPHHPPSYLPHLVFLDTSTGLFTFSFVAPLHFSVWDTKSMAWPQSSCLNHSYWLQEVSIIILSIISQWTSKSALPISIFIGSIRHNNIIFIYFKQYSQGKAYLIVAL